MGDGSPHLSQLSLKNEIVPILSQKNILCQLVSEPDPDYTHTTIRSLFFLPWCCFSGSLFLTGLYGSVSSAYVFPWFAFYFFSFPLPHSYLFFTILFLFHFVHSKIFIFFFSASSFLFVFYSLFLLHLVHFKFFIFMFSFFLFFSCLLLFFHRVLKNGSSCISKAFMVYSIMFIVSVQKVFIIYWQMFVGYFFKK